ncbi:MAG TPA: hypothetical protein VF765_31615 [Polyangiaceae bacterium]
MKPLVRSSLVIAVASVLAGTGCSSSDTTGPGNAGGSSGGSSGSGGGSGSTSSGGSSSSGSGGSSGSSSSGSGGGSGGGSGSSSSGGSSSSSGGGTQVAWHTGMTIGSSITIPAGETVTIDPGATITMGSGVAVTVDGTLTASSAATHAKLSGSSWVGLVVSGTLSLDGVDISGASSAIDVKGGGKGEYDDGTIDASAAPFTVESGGSLGMKHSTLSKAAGTCNIAGSFTADYLTYTGGGAGFFDGFVTTDPGAQLSIEDSTFTGPGPNGPLHDMLVSSSAAKFHVAYTSISGMHCGFHFGGLSEFDISYVNDDSNAFGFMLYGSSGAGPFTVSYSNIDDNGANGVNAYDAEGTNGPITFDHDYVNGQKTDPSGVVSTTNASSSKVSGTGPR